MFIYDYFSALCWAEGEEPGVQRQPGVHQGAARGHLPGGGGLPRISDSMVAQLVQQLQRYSLSGGGTSSHWNPFGIWGFVFPFILHARIAKPDRKKKDSLFLPSNSSANERLSQLSRWKATACLFTLASNFPSYNRVLLSIFAGDSHRDRHGWRIVILCWSWINPFLLSIGFRSTVGRILAPPRMSMP